MVRAYELRSNPAYILQGKVSMRSADRHFVHLFKDALKRPRRDVPRVTTVRSIVLSHHPTKTLVGLTRYSRVRHIVIFSKPRQTITFYSDLLGQLSDGAAEGVIAHELAHAWLNEHVVPAESLDREREADDLAREWGFGQELDALDSETETVSSEG